MRSSSGQTDRGAIIAALIGALILGIIGPLIVWQLTSQKALSEQESLRETVFALQTQVASKANTIGELPTASSTVSGEQLGSAPTDTPPQPPSEDTPTHPTTAPTNTAIPNTPTSTIQNALSWTEEDVIALLIPNEGDWSIVTAKLTDDKSGWKVETKIKTGHKNAEGEYVDGKRIIFHYPGYGVFDYWSGEPDADSPCESILITAETKRLTCPGAMDVTVPKLDGVSWYP
jgi:type II secretory pathway pseudopilin PulG